MRPFVAFGSLMAVLLVLLLWQGSDAIVHVRSPFRPARATYATYPVELEGSPVYYPHERQVHRRAAQPHPDASLLDMLKRPKPTESVAAVEPSTTTITEIKTTEYTRTRFVRVTASSCSDTASTGSISA